MLCPNCGKEVSAGSAFCPFCGNTLPAGPDAVSAAAPGGAGGVPPEAAWSGSAYTPSPAPGVPADGMPFQEAVPAKKSKTGLIIGCVAGSAALIVLAVALMLTVFASPKEQVEKAFIKSTAVFAAARSQLELPDLTKLLQDKSFSQRYSVELDSVSQELSGGYDLSSLNGLGLQFSTDYDQSGRKMGAELKAFLGDIDLASLQIQVDDSILSIASPEFTKGSAYGLDTETLGASLIQLGAEDETGELKNFGFNLFDLVETVSLPNGQTEEQRQAVKEAYGQLWRQAEVEKAGKETVRVNGNSVDARLYKVSFPQQALHDCVNAVEAAAEAMNSTENMKKLLLAMGFSQNYIDQAMAGTDTAAMYGQVFDALKESINSDLTLDVYLSGGCVAAVEYSGDAGGAQGKLGLYLGGGGNYVDDLSFVYAEDGKDMFRLSSSGSHAPKDGKFMDTTELVVNDGGTATRLTSTLRYAPKDQNDNFSWELNMGGAGGIAAAGRVTAGRTGLEARLDEVSLHVGEAELMRLKLNYQLGPHERPGFSLSSPKLLADMTENDFEDLYYDLMNNVISWAQHMTEVLPEDLMQILYYM